MDASELRKRAGKMQALNFFDKKVAMNRLEGLRRGKFVMQYQQDNDRYVKSMLIRDHNDDTMIPIKLTDLMLGSWHKGRILSGFLCAVAHKIREVGFTVIEEEDTGLAITVSTMGMMEIDGPLEQVRALLPYGARIRIREPYFLAGCGILISNPAAIQIVTYYPKITLNLQHPSTKMCEETPDSLRLLGNKMFARDEFGAAAEVYSKADVLVVLQRGPDALQRQLFLSCRAECWLKLGDYSLALRDNEAALRLDKTFMKSIKGKVEALWNMHQYISAHEFLQELNRMMVVFPDGMMVKALRFKEQSLLGNHDMSRFLLSGCKEGECDDEVAEFVGPVEIRPASSGDTVGFFLTAEELINERIPAETRMGLFLTADVRRGDLLVVNKALSWGTARAKSKDTNPTDSLVMQAHIDCLARLLPACLRSPRTLAQVMSLPELNKVKKQVPNMDMFRPNVDHDKIPSVKNLDILRLRNVIRQSTFMVSTEKMNESHLWGLPSFINQSCLPNAAVWRCKNFLFVYAAKDMKSGTEILRPCPEPLTYFDARTGQFEQKSRCPRCSLEMEHLESDRFKAIHERHLKLMKTVEYYEGIPKNDDVEGIVRDMEGFMESAGLTQEQQQWIRASYCWSYSMFYSLEKTPDFRVPDVFGFFKGCFETAACGEAKTLAGIAGFCNALGLSLDIIKERLTSCFGHLNPEIMDALPEILSRPTCSFNLRSKNRMIFIKR